LFKKHVLPELPVSVLSPFFNAGFGRPTKDLYTVAGVLILQQTHDLTDLEAVDQLAFNIQWHYALNIYEESDSAKYMCPKTLWTMRTIVAEHGLEDALFNEGTLGLSDFHLEKSGKVIGCPQGHAPLHVKKKKTRYCAAFDLAHCNGCPNQAIFPADRGKKAFYLRFTDKQLRIALWRSAVETDEFKDRYRWRAGVEATMSEFDRRTGVKRLRVRGFKAVRFSAILKALGLNILRAAAVMAAMLAGTPGESGSKGRYGAGKNVFKEQFLTTLAVFIRSVEKACRFGGICA
jgi:hypothetical protein